MRNILIFIMMSLICRGLVTAQELPAGDEALGTKNYQP